MRVSVFTEPHRGASYDDQLRFARLVEAGGFEGFLRADHYQSMGADPGLPGPTDAWLTLAALARETYRIRLGTLVTSATFRLPGPLAVMVAQVDQMSGGRVELGIGAGWYEREHTSYGIPFPPVGERFDRLAEQLEIITGLWRPRRARPTASPATTTGWWTRPPCPSRCRCPARRSSSAGAGPKRTPELAARYADEFNMPFKSRGRDRRGVRAGAGGRASAPGGPRPGAPRWCSPPASSWRSAAPTPRPSAGPRRCTCKSALPPEDPVVGSPAQLVERIGEFAAIGATRVHLRLIDFDDLDHLELIAAEVLPQLDGTR